jgi:hypothetical protein
VETTPEAFESTYLKYSSNTQMSQAEDAKVLYMRLHTSSSIYPYKGYMIK